MGIVSNLSIQLCRMEKEFKNNLTDKPFIYNYLICEDECKFLDKDGLQKYLTETKIYKTFFLKMINEKCIRIINHSKNYKDYPTLDFLPINIIDGVSHVYRLKAGKKHFIENYNFTKFNIEEIVKRCLLILELITTRYPDTKPTII